MSASVPEMLLVELYNQCKFAIQAHASAYSALDRFGQAPMDTFGPGRRYQREVFRNLHSLVAHAANLSSALWPPEDAEAAVRDRADRLREVLELSEDDHVLRRLGSAPDPGPYHDRLHRWIEAHEAGGGYLDHIASSAERLPDLEAEQRIRTFDPSRRELVLWGQTVRVGEVTEAIKRLCLRLEELLADVDAIRSRH